VISYKDQANTQELDFISKILKARNSKEGIPKGLHSEKL
jgi:hypothetical protein